MLYNPINLTVNDCTALTECIKLKKAFIDVTITPVNIIYKSKLLNLRYLYPISNSIVALEALTLESIHSCMLQTMEQISLHLKSTMQKYELYCSNYPHIVELVQAINSCFDQETSKLNTKWFRFENNSNCPIINYAIKVDKLESLGEQYHNFDIKITASYVIAGMSFSHTYTLWNTLLAKGEYFNRTTVAHVIRNLVTTLNMSQTLNIIDSIYLFSLGNVQNFMDMVLVNPICDKLYACTSPTDEDNKHVTKITSSPVLDKINAELKQFPELACNVIEYIELLKSHLKLK